MNKKKEGLDIETTDTPVSLDEKFEGGKKLELEKNDLFDFDSEEMVSVNLDDIEEELEEPDNISSIDIDTVDQEDIPENKESIEPELIIIPVDEKSEEIDIQEVGQDIDLSDDTDQETEDRFKQLDQRLDLVDQKLKKNSKSKTRTRKVPKTGIKAKKSKVISASAKKEKKTKATKISTKSTSKKETGKKNTGKTTAKKKAVKSTAKILNLENDFNLSKDEFKRLIYKLDDLLAMLPEEKVEEFVYSDYYDIYLKIFKKMED